MEQHSSGLGDWYGVVLALALSGIIIARIRRGRWDGGAESPGEGGQSLFNQPLVTARCFLLCVCVSAAQAGVTGVNYQLSITVPLLERLASRVAAGSIVPPPITRISLDDVPDLLDNPSHAEGKTVITI